MLKVALIGNLGRAPEFKDFGEGERKGSFSVATTRYVKKEKTTVWITVVCWDQRKNTVLEDYARKGTKVYVEGELVIREYTDKQGNDRTAVEVHINKFGGELQLLSSREEDSDRRHDQGDRDEDRREQRPKSKPKDPDPYPEDMNDEIPF